MTKKILLVLIIALVIAMLIVPTSAAKPTIKPTLTPTPTLTQKPDPNNAIWDAIHDLQAQVAGLLTRVVDLETNKVSMDDFNALQGRVAALETENAALAARVTKLESGNSCTPSTEVCDGKDNDCDGMKDEGSLCGDGACVNGGCTAELTCPLVLTCMSDCENNQFCQGECYISGSSSPRYLKIFMIDESTRKQFSNQVRMDKR
jgi:hypothetical protein